MNIRFLEPAPIDKIEKYVNSHKAATSRIKCLGGFFVD